MSNYSQTNSPSKSTFLTSNRVNSSDQTDTSRELAVTIAQTAADRKAGDIVVLNMAQVSYLADYFVMMTGYSRVQVRALADAIEDQVKQKYQRSPLRTEGKSEGTWVLQDYGDVMVHIMMTKEREFYNLEAFWVHAEQIEFAQSSGDGGLAT